MNNPDKNSEIKITQDNINISKGSMERSLIALSNNLNDSNIVYDSFSLFLSSFQKGWFYFANLVNNINIELSKKQRSQLSKEIINPWKESTLTRSEKDSWIYLNNLRNKDTHKKPVTSNFEIKRSILTNNGNVLTNNGKIMCNSFKKLSIVHNNEEKDVLILMNDGISAIDKLINSIPSVLNEY